MLHHLCSVDLKKGCNKKIHTNKCCYESIDWPVKAERWHHFKGENDEAGTEDSEGGDPGCFQYMCGSHS
jgi:hypothetical protein